MNVNDLKNSKFLKKDDVIPPIKVTIKSCELVNVAMESQPKEMKWAMYFEELEKPIVLNPTNGITISEICGSEESEDWIGKEIVLYNQEDIMFQGKRTGGVRVRAVKAKAQPQGKAPVREPGDDDVPW